MKVDFRQIGNWWSSLKAIGCASSIVSFYVRDRDMAETGLFRPQFGTASQTSPRSRDG